MNDRKERKKNRGEILEGTEKLDRKTWAEDGGSGRGGRGGRGG